MKTYTFLIGSQDDFESLDEMLDYFENETSPPQAHGSRVNASAHEFEAPGACDQETVTMIGRGIAFSNDWCMDGPFSCMVEGKLEAKSSVDETAYDQINDAMDKLSDKLNPVNDPRDW